MRPVAGTRWRSVLREAVGRVHREWKVALTRVPRPEKWLFVVGCYNSGTELLTRMLGAHPLIAELPDEGQFLTDQLRADFELGLPRMWVLREDLYRLTEADEGPDPVRIQKEWAMRLDRSRPVFLEKSPPNTARTRWLQAHFQPAHFVAIVRNGYAVAEGIRRKAEPRHRQEGWPLELCARQWARSNEVLLQDAEHLERLLWVRYEDLTADPVGEAEGIFDFLDLPPPPRGLLADRSWRVHERNEPIRNMNAESIARLSEREKAIVAQVAGPMLERFGYDAG